MTGDYLWPVIDWLINSCDPLLLSTLSKLHTHPSAAPNHTSLPLPISVHLPSTAT